jgi:RNA recognition motif-containing protein
MTIFVGNLSFRTSEDDLRCLFQNYGTVQKAKIATERDTGRRRGFAFIEMQNDGEAARAVSALNGKELHRRALRVNAARTREHQIIGAQRFGDQSGTGPSRSFGPLRVRQPQW